MDSGEPLTADFVRIPTNVSLIVSGGHTLLVKVGSELYNIACSVRPWTTRPGECFDKIGKLMGLPYPAGPEIDRLAEQGNPKAFDFPRPLLHDAERRLQLRGIENVGALFFP